MNRKRAIVLDSPVVYWGICVHVPVCVCMYVSVCVIASMYMLLNLRVKLMSER